jgi:ADP-heptose:LPS heptosyltransferase
LLENNPHLDHVWIWDKSKKYRSLFQLIKDLRLFYFEHVFTVQRFLNMGILTALLRAKNKVGFDKNPFSFFFTRKVKHLIPHEIDGSFLHEVQRNYQLIDEDKVLDAEELQPKVYLKDSIVESVKKYKESDFIVMAPSSVWFTKQWSRHKWTELANKLAAKYKVYLIGAPSDKEYCEKVRQDHPNIINLCGELSLLESAALMMGSKRVFANDSAPLHLASSVNAPTTGIFCSTVPAFGYFPLSFDSKVIQVDDLDCRPCGLHGKVSCPQGHFKCSEEIQIEQCLGGLL